MIDKRVYGTPLALAKNGLELIAACNPYRRFVFSYPFFDIGTILPAKSNFSKGFFFCISEDQLFENCTFQKKKVQA